MMESVEDLAVAWTLHGPELARRILAQADQFELQVGWAYAVAAERIREIVACEHNPLADGPSQLGDPPTLRPAVPRTPEPGS